MIATLFVPIHVKQTPARAVTDVIPAATTPGLTNFTGWKFKSHTGLARGVCVKSIRGANGTTPVIVWIGFNKQPPGPFQVLDSFESPQGFKTVEFYNNTNTNWTIVATIYDGDLRP